ncbi:MAG: alpha-L-rhamnosidase-related protein [Flavisolibacter sp.]
MSSAQVPSSRIVWETPAYTVYRDSIVQNNFVARALSATQLTSNYQSPANQFKSPAISFKFSINGKDNEMKSGIDHHFVVIPHNGQAETPLIKFGTQLNDQKETSSYLPPNTSLKIRLDMREVLEAFKKQGYYTTFKGEKIYQTDFKGVYVAGSTAPLTWDFDNLVNHPKLQLHDEDGDGIYEVVLQLNQAGEEKTTAKEWKASKDVSAFPKYTSTYPISDVLYNLAMEEMINAVEPDSTFRTGKEWAGVWTRDISYSIILSMAYLQPRVAIKSLLRKVNDKKKIIQDTGTGGAWPVSSDRMIWAVAAWEIYKATGDRDWLQEAYRIIRNSLEDDEKNIADGQTGLRKGESSFLDWREQTYPKWMQPVDIAESECLGTNAVHYQAHKVLAEMALALGEKTTADQYFRAAQQIKNSINRYLWQPARQYYGQYLYGRNHKILSPRSEALGEALTVLFDIAEGNQQKQVVAHTPVTAYGISCIFPQIPHIPPYHNNAVWPFVQTYWLWASAKAGNEKAVMESIAAIYRPAALFVTNKENFVADNGDFAGTQINSSNMLWSLAGNISIVHKVLFGIRFNEEGLVFQPFVPRQLEGKRSLNNFTYRNAVLDIKMEGYGNRIQQFLLDGKITRPEISASLKGRHQISIVLTSTSSSVGTINKGPNYTSLPTPDVHHTGGALHWQALTGAVNYKVLQNGKPIALVKDTSFRVRKAGYSEYQVIALDKKGVESFASEPVLVVDDARVKIYEAASFAAKSAAPYKGFLGSGFVEISKTRNQVLSFPVSIAEEGLYTIDFRYANGNGPTNTENKCAIRTLQLDKEFAGTALFPQRGKEEWSDWGWSNAIQVRLSKGTHTISLVLEEWNENMNGEINQAMIDQMRLIKTGITSK